MSKTNCIYSPLSIWSECALEHIMAVFFSLIPNERRDHGENTVIMRFVWMSHVTEPELWDFVNSSLHSRQSGGQVMDQTRSVFLVICWIKWFKLSHESVN